MTLSLDPQGDLDRLVPDVACKGLCAEACGPVAMTAREAARLTRAWPGVETWTAADGFVHLAVGPDLVCPVLVDGRCGAYRARPMICRLWGTVERMRCPHGCEPARWVPDADAGALIEGRAP